jgi:very-short-patch-repair endonuclease
VAAESDGIRPQLQPPSLEARIVALAGRQHGVVTLGQLAALGLGKRAVHHRVVAGRLHRVHRGVYAVGHRVLPVDGRRIAAVLACGEGAVLSHRSAGAAWGLRDTARARLEVTTPRRGRRSPAGIELHETRALAAEDVTTLRGIPITSVARTLVDLAGVLGPDPLERAVNQAEVLRLLDVGAVLEALERVPARRGSGRLRAILATPSPGVTRSRLEECFLALLRRSDLPPATFNAAVATPLTTYHPDAMWPRERVIAELDSVGVHHTRRAFERDRRRDAALAAEGYVVVRITDARLKREPEPVLDELRRVLRLRGGCS